MNDQSPRSYGLLFWTLRCVLVDVGKAFWALTPIPLADACVLANSDEYEKAMFRHNVNGFRTFMRIWMLIGLVPIYAFIPVMWALWKTLAPYAGQVADIIRLVFQ